MRILKILCLVLLLCLSCCALSETGNTAFYISALTTDIYESPSVLSPSHKFVSYGESITVLGFHDLWARIQTADGRSGYCKRSTLTPYDPSTFDLTLPALADVTATHAPVTPAKKIAEIPAGTPVCIVALCSENEYLRVEIDGKYAYVPAEAFCLDLPDHDQLRWIVSDTRVNVYGEPDFWTDPIASLSHGECLEILSYLDTDFGDYACIRMQDGTSGYINQTDAISHTDPNIFEFPMYARISGKLLCDQALNPDSASTAIAKGDEVTVVAIAPDAHKLRLRYNGEYYYARSYFFSTEPNDAPLMLQASTTVDVYMDDSLRAYQEDVLIPAPYWDEPTGEMMHPSNVLCKLSGGDTVEILGLSEKNNSLIVRCADGSTGYCRFYGLASITEPF